MKIVYFGSDVFLSCFTYFLRQHQILALYTYHNDEDYFTEYAIVKLARQRGIPVHYEAITPQEITRYFTEEGCELFFIAEYDRILTLPQDLPAFRGINTHSSLLPQGRSYYPIEGAMERDLPRTGVTMHKVAQRLDGGDVLAQRVIDITDEMDSVDIYLRCAAEAREMAEDLMDHLEDRWAAGLPQTGRHPYWKRPAAPLLTLSHTMRRSEALAVFRKYNAMTQVELDGAWYYVTAVMTGTGPLHRDVQYLSPTRVLYRAADGHLRLQIHPMEVCT